MSPEQSDRSDLPTPPNQVSKASERPVSKSSPPTVRSWLVVNTLGFAIAITLLVLLGFQFSGRELFLTGLVISALVGPLQAIVLRQKIPRLRIWHWVLVSILGSYLGVFLGLVATFLLSTFGLFILVLIPFAELFVGSLLGAMVGACVGLGQVLVLARHVRGVRGGGVADVVGRSLGWLSAQLLWQLVKADTVIMVPPNSIRDLPIVLLCGAVGGLVYGGVTARALPLLIARQPAITNSQK